MPLKYIKYLKSIKIRQNNLSKCPIYAALRHVRHMRLVRSTLHGQKTEVPDLAASARQAIPCGHASGSQELGPVLLCSVF